jgi:CoA:oxalate CoA-transferase
MKHESSKNKPRPLAGIRVLDFSIMIAGPYCTRHLSDLGAEVIKVESPDADYLRSREPIRDGQSTYYGQINCGKRSIMLDLKKPDDVITARELAASVDLVVENFRPGVMKRIGLDYETLKSSNDRLIYCSISGFGQNGPSATRAAYAQIVQAASGYDLTMLQYQPGLAQPLNSNLFIADVLASVYALSATLAAIHMRTSTGSGQHIDLSLMDTMMTVFPYEFQEAQFPASEQRQLYQPVRTSDGFMILCPNTQNNFESLCKAVGKPEWIKDARFSASEQRVLNWSTLMTLVEQWTVDHSSAECEATFTNHGIPASAYRSVRDAIADPQFQYRSSFSEVKDSSGPFLVPNLPYQFSGATVSALDFVQSHGQDTANVFREFGIDPN